MAYPESGFSIQLCEGEDTFTMTTYHMERLSAFTLACRRLRDLACMTVNFTLLRLFFNFSFV